MAHPSSPATPGTSVVILGCGYLGTAVARWVRAREPATDIVGVVRTPAAAAVLLAAGIRAVHTPALPTWDVARWCAGARVLVAFPPDGVTDTVVAPWLSHAATVVYVSTTGVYGAHRGEVDEATPVDPTDPAAQRRLDAERAYRAVGAMVLRPAGIYGPYRGLHRRVLHGDARMPADPHQVVSRIHVQDLAALCVAALDAPQCDTALPVADDCPVPQGEVMAWLCALLARPLPPAAASGVPGPGQRHHRVVRNGAVKQALGVTLRYPTYQQGFLQCLAAEAGTVP